jgi:hypothetical protein
LPPGGIIGPRYALQLLYSEKSQNCSSLITQQLLKVEKKISTCLKYLEFQIFKDKFKNN